MIFFKLVVINNLSQKEHFFFRTCWCVCFYGPKCICKFQNWLALNTDFRHKKRSVMYTKITNVVKPAHFEVFESFETLVKTVIFFSSFFRQVVKSSQNLSECLAPIISSTMFDKDLKVDERTASIKYLCNKWSEGLLTWLVKVIKKWTQPDLQGVSYI